MLNRKATRRAVLQGLARKRDEALERRWKLQAEWLFKQELAEKAKLAYYESRSTEEKVIDSLYTAWGRAHDEERKACIAFIYATEDYLAALERHDRFAEAIVLYDVEGQVREMVEAAP